MEYIYHLLILMGIYLLICYSFNLTFGFCGLFNLSSGAFYGLGAYAFAILSTEASLGFLPAMGVAVVFCAAVALLVGFPALKLRGDSFVLVTLAFQIIITTVLYNWISVTKGPSGIPGIPRPSFMGWSIRSLPEYFILIVLLNAALLSILFFLYKTPFGLSLRALRDNERGALAIGKSPSRQFLFAFAISGALLAVPGCLYASYITYVDPSSFGLDESIYHVIILALGGSGNKKGPLVGVGVMIFLPELIRFLDLPPFIVANVRQIVFGAALILLMFWRPQGIAGAHSLR